MPRVIQEDNHNYELIVSQTPGEIEIDYLENLDEHIFFNISKVLKLEHVNSLSLVNTTINKRLSDDGTFWKQKYQYKYSCKKHNDKLSWKDNYLNVGSVWFFGDKNFDRVYHPNDLIIVPIPTKIDGHNNIIEISAGDGYSLMLDINGDVWSLGNNGFCQLGLGHSDKVEIPTKIEGLNDVVAVSAGRIHSLALDKNGYVWSFGSNNYGKLGLGDTVNRGTPMKIEGLENITAISAGTFHSLILSDDGTVWSFGRNHIGQLGLGDTVNKNIPTKIEELVSDAKPKGVNIIAISAGRAHNLVSDNYGNVWSFGDNSVGQLGLGDLVSRNIPTKIEELGNIKEISASHNNNLVLDKDGNVWSFGNMTNDNLDRDSSTTPVKIEGFNGIKAISTGLNHSLLVGKDGDALSFGSNSRGQLGLWGLSRRGVPNKIEGLSKCVAISCGESYSLVLR